MPDMEVCAECNRHIADQFVLRVGESSLHQECLKCASCRAPLTDSCFSKFGQFYCRQDFYRMFGPRCSACQLVFAETDKARKMGESLFHTHCFTCHDCSANLTEGDKVGCDHRGNLFCEIDYIKHTNGSSGGSEVSEDTSQYFDLDTSNGPTVPDELTVKREAKTPDTQCAGSDEEGEGRSAEGNPEDETVGKDGKRRGPRTTIKAKQLEILKTCFDQNPKPTRQVREQLAKETGLPMRVIQVWFQNKRSKQKRINQMHYITGRFPPHMGMPFPPHPYGPPGPFGFGPPPPGAMPGDYPPPGPHMFPPDFGPCGPPPPGHPDFRPDYGPGGPPGPYPPYHPGHPGPDFHDQSGRMSESPNHCFPSPPTHPGDYPSPPMGDYGPPSHSAEPCFPSPPLDYSCPPEFGRKPGPPDFPGPPDSFPEPGSLDVNVKQELPNC